MHTVAFLVTQETEIAFSTFSLKAPIAGWQSRNFLGIKDPKQIGFQIVRPGLGGDYC